MQSSTSDRWLSGVGLVGITAFSVSMLVLHAVQPNLSPIDEAMSYYVHGRHGWLTTLGLISLGIGSSAITMAISRQGKRKYVGVLFLAVWSAGATLGGIFSADPAGSFERPPSISGTIHGLAAMIALTAFPVATIALLPSFRQDRRWQPLYGPLKVLTVAAVVSYAAFMASLAPVFIRPGPPILLGLTERILLVAYVAWLAVVAAGLIRSSGVLPASHE